MVEYSGNGIESIYNLKEVVEGNIRYERINS